MAQKYSRAGLGTGGANFWWNRPVCHPRRSALLRSEVGYTHLIYLIIRDTSCILCPSAGVISQFASSAKAARTQRERWEGGHISMILTTFPRLFRKAIAHRDWDLLALTLDLAVPPLSLLALVVTGVAAISAVLSIPLYILGKLGLYRVKLFNKTVAQWIRTDRTKSE
jgi:cytochrome c oxidase subunit IV